MVTMVYECASPVIRDAIDLAYLMAQRPSDVLRMRWDHIKDGSLCVEQGKTKSRLQINIVGEFAALLDRIKTRGIVGMTILADPERADLKAIWLFQEPVKDCPGQRKSAQQNWACHSPGFNSETFAQKALRIWKAWGTPGNCWGTLPSQ